MNVESVRTALSRYTKHGILRIFFNPDTPKHGSSAKKGTGKNNATTTAVRNQGQRYLDGWIEFACREEANTLVRMLNGQPLGTAGRQRSSSKNRNKMDGDLWCLRYLGDDFAWSHLTEEIAFKRAERGHKLRLDEGLQRKQMNLYLQQVDKARQIEAIRRKQQAKKAKSEDSNGEAMVNESESAVTESKRIMIPHQRKIYEPSTE